MAIDPNLVTTVQVSELPPASFVPESILAHQIGDILSRGTIQELVNYIRSQSVSQPYETKFLTIPQSEASVYINENFDMTVGVNQGIGKVGGIWEGWAIHNGNNGTYNLDGQTLIGYGANHPSIGNFLGSKDAVVVSHTHAAIPNTNLAFGSGTVERNRALPEASGTGIPVTVTVESTGESGIGKNMQPSMVCLMIMKLP